MKKIPAWLWLVVWCVAGMFLRVSGDTVLNHPSSATDYWIPLSGAWALHCGVPLHAQASSPLGVLFYAPYEFVTWIFGMSDRVVCYTQAGLFAAVATLSFFLLRARFGMFITMLATAYFSLFATSPGNMGDSPFITYEGIGYDFLALALGQLALLVAVFPRRDKKDSRDGIAVGLLLVWEMFIKPNLLVTDVFLIMAGLLLLRPARSHKFYFEGILSAAIFATVALVVFHVDIAGWLSDLKQASQARGFQVMTVNPVQYQGGNLTWGVAALYSDAINRLTKNVTEWLPGVCVVVVGLTATARMVRTLLFLGLLFAVELALPEFNSITMTFGFFWIIAFCLLKENSAPMIFPRLVAILAAVCTGLWMLRLLVTFSYDMAAPGHFPSQSPQYPFTGTAQTEPFGHLYFQRAGADRPGHDFAAVTESGIALLYKNGLEHSAILDFDFVNPFPMFLRAQYPKGQPVWSDGGGTFNLAHHVPPETFFGGADAVLVPKQVSTVDNFKMLAEAYGNYLTAHYSLKDENSCWRLFIHD